MQPLFGYQQISQKERHRPRESGRTYSELNDRKCQPRVLPEMKLPFGYRGATEPLPDMPKPRELIAP